MAEAQKIRDREIRGIRSSNRYSNRVNKDRIDSIKFAEDIIQDLERHGPAGLIHIGVLSNIIGKPIRIWNVDGSLNKIIGKRKTGRSIDVEYHTTDLEQIGHWTLKHGKDPDNISIDLNSCLFSVIGSQIGQNPSKLRKWTVLKLKSNLRRLANRMDEILSLEKNDKIILMIGGARYCGTSPSHARMILDRSQGQKAHRFKFAGHPRGHASHPSPPNVEEYSIEEMKSAFLSRADQDYVTHLALTTQTAQNEMNNLNNNPNIFSLTVTVYSAEMNSRNLPKARNYVAGKPSGKEKNMRGVRLVLRHHEGQHKNPDADVFVQTCFPLIG
ncbi:preprotein translocase subunit-like protein [Lasius niger]|uniref:Preprotein translocase subunit-like protein n=1 Tax=Lasius niger TaxID=67767 RepID=A0A0J7L3M9_LASNI|nr:preprotein translocase subunit-like protein [Lasius niger]